MAVAVSVGPICISWSAENVSWAPDVVKDMQNRTLEMAKELMTQAYEFNLFDQNTVFVADGDEDGETSG